MTYRPVNYGWNGQPVDAVYGMDGREVLINGQPVTHKDGRIESIGGEAVTYGPDDKIRTVGGRPVLLDQFGRVSAVGLPNHVAAMSYKEYSSFVGWIYKEREQAVEQARAEGKSDAEIEEVRKPYDEHIGLMREFRFGDRF